MGIRSMTAYGNAHVSTSCGVLLVEIHSVNRKVFDVTSHLPRELLCYDMEIRKKIQKKIKRGQVTLRITKELSTENIENFLPNFALLKELKNKWVALGSKLGFAEEEVNLKFLTEQAIRFPSFDASVHEGAFKENLLSGIEEALLVLLEMKQKEGGFLEKDIRPRIEQLKAVLDKIKKRSTTLPEQYREKLLKRISELSSLTEDDRERIYKEVVFFAEKSDITEEITRLYSHMDQFYGYLNGKEESVGKTLDFILQEMHREINTIASKSTDVEISKMALSLRCELEKIKEQIQNIE